MKNQLVSLIANKAPGLGQKVGRAGLQFKKQSPHIFFVGGVVGVIGSTVLACRSTLKLPETLTEIEHNLDVVREIKKDAENTEYPADTSHAQRDVAYVYARSAYSVVKLYGPAIVIGAVSIGALTGSHIQLARRNTALLAAYTAAQSAFDDYRAKVAEEYGEEKELDIFQSCQDIGEVQAERGPTGFSQYARFYDEGAEFWEKNAELNRFFIICQQNYLNDLLRARGHVFLNEAYDRLGLERTSPGAVVGWVIGDSGDNYIDFGLENNPNPDFLNGDEPRTILDFNVDGVIFDKI